jgi:glycosyltransferase involved in cell wall biosynthesis
MNLVATIDLRYMQTPDGAIWTKVMFGYEYWARYLQVFDHVCVAARVKSVEAALPDWHRADGEGVSFHSLPHYIGPMQFLVRRGKIRRVARAAVKGDDAVILYGGSPISSCLAPMLQKSGHPYGIHVGGDPFDVFAPGSVKHPLRRLFRWWLTKEQITQCRMASAAVYVTDEALQRRYPCPEYSVGVSDVELPDEAIVTTTRTANPGQCTFNLVTVGTMEQLYKAPDVLIDAVALCIRNGLDIRLTLIGDGKHRKELEARTASRGIKDRVSFLGQLSSGSAVRKELDKADVFVLASHQEGLPRAMVEAMARALPCIGSTVGGIPELLYTEDMVRPGNATLLAAKIKEVVTNPDRLVAMSQRNLEKAGQFQEDIRNDLWLSFCYRVRERTEQWLAGEQNKTAVRIAA